METAKVCLQTEPTIAPALATALQPRFSDFGTGDLISLVGCPSSHPGGQPFGFFTVLGKQDPKQREELTAILFNVYRQELIKRMNAEKGENPALVNTIIDLTKLRNPAAGWKPLGKVPPSDRVWRFKSFDPIVEKDQLPTRERRRFREIQLPVELKDWFRPDYDDSQWSAGRAPIGTGLYKQGAVSFANQSQWGKGEFIVMRTTFEVDVLDCDSYRLSLLSPQGFHVYLNGHRIAGYGWWQDKPHYAPWNLDRSEIRHLKKGTNVLAVCGNVEYDQKTKMPFGQMDCMIEGLKKSDLQ